VACDYTVRVWGIASVALVVAAVGFLALLAIGRDVADAAFPSIASGIAVAVFLGVVRARRDSRG
jgi:hypothetical protein